MKHLFILLISALSISFYGQTAEAYYNSGEDKSNLGHYKEAIEDYTKAINSKAKYTQAFYRRGYSKYELKEYKGAIEDFTKTIKLDTNYTEAYYYRGTTKDILGDKDGACLDLTKAVELGYQDAYEAMKKICGFSTPTYSTNILGKLLYGAKKDIPLTNNKVYLTGGEGDTLKITTTDEYGDFAFKKVNTESVTIVVGMSDEIINEQEIYLANQNGIIISTIKKAAKGFEYRILPADIKKLSLIVEEDATLKINVFAKSKNTTITVEENIYYATNEYNVTPDIAKKLGVIVNNLTKHKTYQLEIYSHTDSKGDDAANLDLSNKRANAVLDYLVSKGIDKSRLTAKGMGETKIINRCVNGVNCSEKEHELNRRTEFKFIK